MASRGDPWPPSRTSFSYAARESEAHCCHVNLLRSWVSKSSIAGATRRCLRGRERAWKRRGVHTRSIVWDSAGQEEGGRIKNLIQKIYRRGECEDKRWRLLFCCRTKLYAASALQIIHRPKAQSSLDGACCCVDSKVVFRWQVQQQTRRVLGRLH